MELVEKAIRCKVPFGVVVFDAWPPAEDMVRVLARRRKDWISRLSKKRLLETASFHLRHLNGGPLKLPGPQIAVEELAPLIPATADRPIKVGEHTSWCVTLAVRIAGLGNVHIVVSFDTEQLTGRSVELVANRVDWSAAKIIGLYFHRWPTETSLAYLKTTMQRDVLHGKTVASVLKEPTGFALVDHLVRTVMWHSAMLHHIGVERISFLDALRWLSAPSTRIPLAALIVNPIRPHRVEPRAKKRRPKSFPLRLKPRQVIRQQLVQQELTG